MRLSSILLLILLSSSSFAQKNKVWAEDALNKANTAKDAEYLTKEEKQVIFYLNLVRLDPKLFAETYLKKYLDSTKENDAYTKSLIKELPKTKTMDVLQPDKELFNFAKELAVKFGKENKTGHGNYQERTKKIKTKFRGAMAENCDYGNNKGFDIVMSLLIDQNIKDLGHRKNILDPQYRVVGTSIQPHKRYQWNCVMDFAN